MTDNHQYNTPAEGTTNWDVPLNDNFRSMDADIEIRDTDDARSDYTPKDGSKYLATDTGAVYLGDGSQWVHVGDFQELAGDVYVQSESPLSPSTNDIWLDTNAPGLSFYDGSEWVTVSGSSDSTDSDTSKSSVIEDGESDLSAYVGETSYFDITTNAIAGSGAVRASDAEHGSYRTVASTSGLSTYPQAGDTLRCDVAVDTDNTYGGILWGVQSSQSPWPCYRLIIDTGATPGVRFEKVPVGGSIESHNLSSENHLSGEAYHDSGYSPTIGEVYTVEVNWGTDGVMSWTVTDSSGDAFAADASPAADTEYTGGGIGFVSSRTWDGQSEAQVRFDNYELV